MIGLRQGNRQLCLAALLLLSLAGLVSAQQEAKERGEKRNRRVFVPIEDLDVVLSGDRQGVLLQKKQYLQLRARALKNEAATPKPPVPLVLSDVVYTARPSGDHLLVDARVRFQQFTRGWQSLALPLRGVSVERATLDGRPARVGRLQLTRGKQTISGLELFHETPGTATLQLGLSTPLVSLGSDKVAAFGLVPATTATLVVRLPAGKHLLIDGLSVRRPADLAEPATYTLPVGGRREVRLAVTDRQAERNGDVLVFARTGYGINVMPGEVTWQAATSLNVFGQPLDRVVATVPRRLEITSVESSGLQGWELADDPDVPGATRIVMDYRQPFSGSRRIVFKGVMATQVGAPWRVPRLGLVRVTSHVGQVLLQHPPGVRLQVVDTTGVRRTAGAVALKGMPAGTEAMRFDVWRENFSLSFVTETKRQELQAGISTILEIGDRGLDLLTVATIESQFSPLFQVDFSVPTGWNITRVLVAGQPVLWQRLPEVEGRQPLRISFAKALPEGSEVQVTIGAHRDLPDWPLGSDRLREESLPDLALVPPVDRASGDRSSAIIEGTYLIRAPEEYDVVPVDLVGLDNAPVRVTGQRLAYSYQDLQIGGTLRVVRRPARLSAETLAIIRLDRETLSAHLEAHLDIQGGGTRTLVIGLPESAGADLRFRLLRSPYRIVEQLPAPVDKGLRRWTLKLDEFIRGRLSLAVDVTMTRESAAEQDAFRPPTLVVVGAERESGHLAIEAADDQQVKITARAADGKSTLSPVDPADLPPATYQPRERIVAAYRYLVAGYEVTLAETRFAHGEVPTAICHQNTMTSVLARNGEFQHRAHFSLTAAGVQSLVVDLDAGSDTSRSLWAVTIDGVPVKARSLDQGFVVNWPGDEVGVRQHELEIFYQSRLEPLISSGNIVQSPPRLTLVGGTGQKFPIEVLEQDWVVHHPLQTAVVESRGRFVAEGELDQISLLGRMRDNFEVASPADLLSRGLVLLLVVGGLSVLTVSFRRRRIVGLAVASLVLVAIGVGGSLLFVVDNLLLTVAPSADRASTGSEMVADYDMALPQAAHAENEETSEAETRAPGAGGFGGGMGGGGFAGDADGVAGLGGQRANDPGKSDSRRNLIEADANAKKDTAPRGSDDEKRPAAEPASPPRPPGTPIGQSQVAAAGEEEPQESAAEGPSQVRVEKRAGGKTSDGAVLSLALKIEPPAGSSVERRFHFLGSEAGQDESAGLDVSYQDREAQVTGRWFWIMLVVMTGWFLRFRPVAEKATGMIVALVGPLALVTVLPASSHVWLDGLFLGAVVTTGLWFCDWGLRQARLGWQWCLAHRPGWLPRLVGVLLAAILAAGTVTGGDALGQKKRQPAAGPPVPTPREVVPFDPDEDPIKASRVLIPQAEFLRLWNLAYPDRRILPAARRPGVVAEAAWEARIVEASGGAAARVTVTGRLELYSFRNGQVLLPIPVGAVALGKVRLDGQPAAIVTRPKSATAPLAVIVRKAGRHELTMDFDVPLQRTGPAGQFRVPLSSVPAGRFRFQLPARDLLVRVNGTTTRHRRSVVDDAEVIDIGVDAGGPLQIAWQPRQALEAARGLIQLESYLSVHVADEGLRRRESLRFRVRQGALPEVAFLLPASVRVQRVAGLDVGGWDLEEKDEQRRLRVFFRRRVTDATIVHLELFQDVRVGEKPVPVQLDAVHVEGLARDNGQLALFVGDQFSVRTGTLTGLKQIDLKEHRRPAWVDTTAAPPEKKSVVIPPRFHYRYISRPFGLQLQLARRVRQSVAIVRHAARMEQRKTRISTRVRWQLTQATWSGVTLQIPLDYLPVGVDATAMSDWYVHETDDGDRRLTIEFATPRTGEVDVVLDGIVPRSPDDLELELAVPRPLGVKLLTSQLAVWIDEAYTARVSERGSWRAIDPANLAAELRQRDPRPARFAFDATANEIEAVILETVRATPGLVAAAVSVVTVTDTLADFSLAMSWQITLAAADEFVFTTPGWLEGRLQFKDTRLREFRSEPIEGTEKVRWTITLNEPVRDQFFILAQATLPPPVAVGQAAAILEAPELVFEQVDRTDEDEERHVIKSLSTQERYVILINRSSRALVLDPNDDLKRVEKDELADVKVRIDNQLFDQATVMLHVPTGTSQPRWTVAMATTEQGATAEVQLADLVSVLAADGSWRTRAVYTVRNRSQQFLAVIKPQGARVLSVTVRGIPSRPVEPDSAKENNVVLVALPNTSQGDRSFEVRLILAGRRERDLPTGLHVSADKLDVPVPRVVAPDEDGAIKRFGMPVRETSWTVYLPREIDVEFVDDERTNLIQVDSEHRDFNWARAQLRDANQLLQVLDSEVSAKTKYKALDNLQKLESTLKGYEQQGPRSSRRESGSRRDFADSNQKFQGRWLAAQERYRVDAGRQVVTLSEDSAGTGILDEKSLEKEIFRNNDRLNALNYRQLKPQQQDKSGDRFAFDFKRSPQNQAKKQPTTKGGKGKESTTRQRDLRRKQSLDQLGVLNKSLEQKKTAELAQQKEVQQQFAEQAQPQTIAQPNQSARPGADSPVGGMVSQGQTLDLGNNVLPQRGGAMQEVIGDGELALVNRADQSVAGEGPAGGLSVEFDIPTGGQVLHFAKAQGGPRLALSMRPRESIEIGLNGLWALAWLAVATALVVACRRAGTLAAIRRHLAKGLVGVGVVGFLLLPGVISWLAFLVFLGGAVTLAVQLRGTARRSPIFE